MGCSESSVVENSYKLKPMKTNFSRALFSQLVMGEITPNKFKCFSLVVTENEEDPIQIHQNQVPQLITKDGIQKPVKIPNFGQLVQIGQSSVYILTGGINQKLDHIYNQCYLYNKNTNSLHPLPGLLQPRYTHSTVVLNNMAYTIGGRYFGQDNTAILNKCQCLSLPIDGAKSSQELVSKIVQNATKWEMLPSMNVNRCSMVALVYMDRIYAVGGYTAEYQRSTLIEYLDLNKNKWILLAVQLPFGVESCTALSVDSNQFCIFGGNSNNGPLNTALEITLLEGREAIMSRGKMKSKRMLHRMLQSDKNIWLLGGNEQMSIQKFSLNKQTAQNSTKKPKSNNVLREYFETQSNFQASTQSSRTLTITYNPEPDSPPESQKSDEVALVFGTDTEPFILQLNITVPYTYTHQVPLQLSLFALQSVVHISQTNEYLLFGGISDSQQEVNKQSFIFSLSDRTRTRRLGDMNYSRYAFGGRRLAGWVYAIGGGTADADGEFLLLSKCERVSVGGVVKGQAKWEQICELPVGLISPMTLVHKDSLYVFGGMKKNKQRFQNILRLSSSAKMWQQLSYKFPFGLQASSIYQKSDKEYYIFGGRVVNGDTSTIWNLTFINDGSDCVFEQKGKMKQPKCLHNVYKPKHQNFVVVLGGSEREVLGFYDCQSLEAIESDILSGLKNLFVDSLGSLSDKTLKNYTMAIRE